MKRILKSVCASALIMGLCFGTAAISHAYNGGLEYTNECNANTGLPETGGAVLVDNASDRSPDGTAYIKASDTQADWLKNSDGSDMAFEMVFSTKAISSFCTWETDIKFTQTGAGFSIRNNTGSNAGNLNTTIVYGSDKTLRYSSSTGTRINSATLEPDKWYHIALVGVYGDTDGKVKFTVSEYDENGGLVEIITIPEIDRRNNKAPTRFVFTPGTCVDNVRVYEMEPKAIALTTDAEKTEGTINIKAGESITFGNTLYADTNKTMEMTGFSVIYELLNENPENATDYLVSDVVSISPEGGVLTVSGAAEAQSFVVRAKCVDFPEVFDDIVVNVESVPMLEFVGAGFKDDNYDEIVQLKFKQNYENEGDISFIAAVYNEHNVLVDVYNKTLAYRDQKEGELFVTLNQQLPEGFNPETWTIKVFAWSKTIN